MPWEEDSEVSFRSSGMEWLLLLGEVQKWQRGRGRLSGGAGQAERERCRVEGEGGWSTTAGR